MTTEIPSIPSKARFPIRGLVQRTGVNASTLRAWENRHGLLKPVRTQSGHRLYGPEDVQRVKFVQELLVQGVGLNEIVEVLDRPPEATSTSSSGILESSLATTLSPAWQGYLAETLSALETFSTERLDSLYNDACALYPIDIVTEKLMIPVLEQLGMRWDKRPSGIAEEHFFSAWLRNKLGARLHHGAGLARGRSLILSCLPGEHHEISLLLAALGILQKGYRAVYLGADMPVGQLVPVYRQTHAGGIILAGREITDSARIEANLIDIADLVKNVDIPVFVGGRFSVVLQRELEQIGAQTVGDNISLGLRLIEAGLSIAQNPASRMRKR
jgi:MerR family transcriptional regulator, light-induced transcriptional regulator